MLDDTSTVDETTEKVYLNSDNLEKEAKEYADENISSFSGILSSDQMWYLAEALTKYCELQNPWEASIAVKELRPYQRALIKRIIYGVLSGPSRIKEELYRQNIVAIFARQCLVGSTPVLLRDGTSVCIKDAPNAWNTGIKPVYAVTNEFGRTVAASKLHPFKTKDGWTNLEDLTPGMQIQILKDWEQLKDTTHATPTISCCEKGIDGEQLGWATVTSVEYLGEEETWDMEVPEKGWFIANGFVVHNSGKTEAVSIVINGLIVMLPVLANSGVFTDPRILKYASGLHVGVYGPTYEAAGTLYERMRSKLFSKHTVQLLKDPANGINLDISKFRGKEIRLPNGSFVFVGSAGPAAKIEGKTYHLCALEESQDIPDIKLRKSIWPMLAAKAGMKIMIGTPSHTRNMFYEKYVSNRERDNELKKTATPEEFERAQSMFAITGYDCAKYDYDYAAGLAESEESLGIDSEEFRMSYMCEWIGEAGIFISETEFKDCGLERKHTYKEEIAGKDSIFTVLPSRELTNSEDLVAVGIDFGQVQSHTICTAIKYWEDKELYDGNDVRYRSHIIDWFDLEHDDYEKQFPQIINWLCSFNKLAAVCLDSTGPGKPLSSRFKAELVPKGVRFVPFSFNQSTKHEGYALLNRELRQHRLTYPAGIDTKNTKEYKQFYREMTTLEKEFKGKYYAYHKPTGDKKSRDDYCDSLMLACWGINKGLGRVYSEKDYSPFGSPIEGSIDAWESGQEGHWYKSRYDDII